MKRLFLLSVLVITLFTSSITSFECGIRKKSVNEAIVRGQQTSPGDWPWHAAIFHRKRKFSNSYACGGTLISELFVLTAIHCVKGENGHTLSPRKVFVKLGVHNLDKLEPYTQQHDVHVIHQFDDSKNLRNDIALLRLETQAVFNSFVQPTCVNQVEDLTRISGTAVGWGTDETDELSAVLKSATMPVVSGYQCLENSDGVFRLALDSSLFCAGFANGTNVCNGDSGGGLHFQRNGVWYVGGIVSFTAPRDKSNLCHTESYAAFTNVYHFIPWIRHITQLPYLNEHIGFRTDQIATTIDILPKNCGQTLRNRISRGSTTNVFEYPWMAVLRYRDYEIAYDFCSGTIIHQRYVLTSALCLKTEHPVKVDHVILGEYNKSSEFDCTIYRGSNGEETERECSNPARKYNVESYVYHKKYNKNEFTDDIGLIRLAKDITWEYHIQPICLPVSPRLRVKQFKQYFITGWGLNEDYTPQDVLQEAILPLISNSNCQRRLAELNYKIILSEQQMCTGGEQLTNACYGDSGGPLGAITNNNGLRFTQFGVVTGVFNTCGLKNVPTVFTRVANYMDWILQNIAP